MVLEQYIATYYSSSQNFVKNIQKVKNIFKKLINKTKQKNGYLNKDQFFSGKIEK